MVWLLCWVASAPMFLAFVGAVFACYKGAAFTHKKSIDTDTAQISYSYSVLLTKERLYFFLTVKNFFSFFSNISFVSVIVVFVSLFEIFSIA